MKITSGKVAGINYILTDASGSLLDQNETGSPLEYIHGSHSIISGLETELEGLSVGDKKTVIVQPEAGYGMHDDRMVQEVPKSAFPATMQMQVGMQVEGGDDKQGYHTFIIKEMKEDVVVLDGNHPLSGKILHFDVEVVSIREATKQEIEHGHIHHGGHDH